MGAVVDIGFDYGEIAADGRDDVKEAAVRIRLRMSRTVEDIIEIGRDLERVKNSIGHGNFVRWIEAEFAMSASSAERFMNVAARFGDKIVTVTNLASSVLYALAAPSTDDAVVEEVLDRSAAGETISPATVKALKDEWAAERRELKRQLDQQKLEARDAKSTQGNFDDQLQELRADLANLRDERDTLKHELEHQPAPAAAPAPTAPKPPSAAPMDDDLIVLMAAWKRASKESRDSFLASVNSGALEAA